MTRDYEGPERGNNVPENGQERHFTGSLVEERLNSHAAEKVKGQENGRCQYFENGFVACRKEPENNHRSSSLDDEPPCRKWWVKSKEIDLEQFLKLHPGGSETLLQYIGQDVSKGMLDPRHSPEAYYLLRDIAKQNEEEDDLVDWSKPMLSQVGQLGVQYKTWVWKPVDRPLRLFGHEWLEYLSGTHWHQVVSVWTPFILATFYSSLVYAPPSITTGTSTMCCLVALLFGISLWPLYEYTIHRWVFHFQPPEHSSTLITLHFLLHGLHHKVPFDERRLLFPPVPASLMMIGLYYAYSYVFPYWFGLAVLSGTTLGYLLYDLVHFYIHHCSPADGTYLYKLKRQHNQHHFAQQTLGFGISSDLWDHVFNTLVELKLLKFPLSWEVPVKNENRKTSQSKAL